MYFHLKSDFPLTFLQTLPSCLSQPNFLKKKKKPSFLLILSSTWSNFSSNCHKAKSYSIFQSPLLSQVPPFLEKALQFLLDFFFFKA